MDPRETLRQLHAQAASIPHASVPSLRRRKTDDLPGTYTFRADERAAHTPLQGLPTYLSPDPAINTHSYSSGVQFRPVMTPESLPRTASSRGANTPASDFITSFLDPSSSSATSHDDPFDPPMSPDSFLDHTDADFDGLSTNSDAHPFRRRRTTNAYTKIHNLLADLRRDRISPVDILIQVLDSDDIAYDRYRGNLYRKDSKKLSLLLEKGQFGQQPFD